MQQKTNLAIFLKSLSWQGLGVVSMTMIGFVTTGSWQSGGVIAITSAVFSIFTFFIHEKVWDKLTAQ